MMIKNLFPFKRAFTMLELIFVIVILGIVASIGSSMIANVYESYIVQRALHRASSKTELAVQQIANRLANRISVSVIAKKSDHSWELVTSPIILGSTEYRILEWIGVDADSFSAQRIPGWSGFCDTAPSTRTDIITPGSDLNTTEEIIINLGATDINDSAIIFSALDYAAPPLPTKVYQAGCMGFTPGDYSCISPVSAIPSELNITVTDNNAKTIRDQYKLVWSAFAIVPLQRDGTQCTDASTQICDLYLYYNYQPWKGEAYTAGSVSLLSTDISVFKFKGEKEGDTIRFKICAREQIGDHNITSCKEKAVIR